MAERRIFTRAGEEARRRDLLDAARALVGEAGPQGATVRAIAARAGVTPGLIRHYFGSKEALLAAAYLELMSGMADVGDAALAGLSDPVARLAGFVAANLRPPVVDSQNFVLWAGFMQQVARDGALEQAHEAGYLAFRDRLEALVAACGLDAAQDKAVALNALIDGLWLEASVLPGAFGARPAVAIGLEAAGRIVGLDLAAALAEAGADLEQAGRGTTCAMPV